MSDFEQILSRKGEQRRERILQLAVCEALSRKRRRRAARVGILAGTAVCAAVAVAVIWPGRNHIPAPEVAPQILVQTSPVQPSSVQIAFIESDATIVDRLSLGRGTRQWQNIGDDELLQGLADAGRPSGLIRVAGHTILLPQRLEAR
jgi:hypothetical protein